MEPLRYVRSGERQVGAMFEMAREFDKGCISGVCSVFMGLLRKVGTILIIPKKEPAPKLRFQGHGRQDFNGIWSEHVSMPQIVFLVDIYQFI